MTTDPDRIQYPVIKAVSALSVGVGLPTVAQVAQWTEWLKFGSGVIAFFFAFVMFAEWWWKKLWRPLAEKKGWLKKKRRRIILLEDYDSSMDELRTADGKELK